MMESRSEAMPLFHKNDDFVISKKKMGTYHPPLAIFFDGRNNTFRALFSARDLNVVGCVPEGAVILQLKTQWKQVYTGNIYPPALRLPDYF